MPISLRKRSAADPVGLDLDGGYLAAVQASGRHVCRAASADAPEGAIRDGEVADPEALGAALKDLFRAHELPRDVRLGVANQQIVVRELELPRIEDPRERDAAVRFQAADAVAMPLDEAVLDYQVVGETVSPEGTPRMQVTVVAARRAMVDQLVAAVRAAGLRPVGVDLSAFALVRLLGDRDDSAGARVLCHLGGVTTVAIAAGPVCRFTRTVAALPGGDPDDVAAALAAEIAPSIDYFVLQPGALALAGVRLAGPGSSRAGLAEALTARIGMPVEVAEPFGGLQGAVLVPGEDPHRHTVAAGLAIGAAA
jgi:type IV pilus assembly protein PilM